jgi:MATE family multidrug resistance protein
VTNATTWNRRVLSLALPIILSNASVPLLGAVDTAVMGHLPDPAYIGAVAVGAMIFSFLYWGFGFLRMGTTGFTAQAFGAEDAEEMRAALARPLLLGLIIGLCLIALQALIAPAAFYFMDASAQVEGFAQTYFDIRIWGAPATLITYALLGWLLGGGNARAVLYIQLLLNGLNIALNLIFVLGLGMTIDGVALATVISEYTALAFGLLLAAGQMKSWPGVWERARILERARLTALFRVNLDIFIRTFCLQVAFFAFTARSAQLGELQLAANAILLQFETFMAYILDGFAHAVEVLAGNALGARKRAAFRGAVVASTVWAALFALLITLVYAVAGPQLVTLFTDIEAVREATWDFLPWAVVMPLVGVWAYQLDGIFIGATRTAAMRNAMLVSLLGYLPALFLFEQLWGNHGLWLSITLFLGLRGVTLAVCYPALEKSIEPQGAQAA